MKADNLPKKIIEFSLKANIYTISLYTRRIASAFIVFFIARYLSVYEYGLFSSYSNIAGFLLIAANLGFSDYILVSTKNNFKKVRFELTFFMAYAILILFTILAVSNFINLKSNIIFSLILFKVFFDSTFFGLILPLFQASKKIRDISYINIFYSICVILIAVASYIFKLSLINFLILNIILGIINFIQCSANLNYLIIFKKFKSFVAMLDKSIIYYGLVVIVVFIQSQIAALYTSFFLPKEQVAIFFAAWNIANVLSLIAIAQGQQVLPELIEISSYHKLIESIKKNILFVVNINLLVLLFFVIFGKDLLLLLYNKAEYLQSYVFLIILTFSVMIFSVGQFLALIVTARGFQKQKFKLQTEFLIVALITMAVFFKFGIWGAVITRVVTVTYLTIRYGIFVVKYLEELKSKEINA